MTAKTYPPLIHGDFQLERRFKAPVARVFKAWGDVDSKATWFKGPNTWKQLERSLDFRVGGKEVARGTFGEGNETHYIATFHVIEPNARLVFAYDMHHAGSFMSASLVSVDFSADGTGTKMVFTEQIVFVDGKDGTTSRKEGTESLLKNLAAAVEEK